MIASKLLLATAGLLQLSHARNLNIFERQQPNNSALVPIPKTDFAKDGVPAKWAPGYPKGWGEEDFRHALYIVTPDTQSNAAVTSDEKYLVMFNLSHVQFVDLDKNTVASTYRPQLPSAPEYALHAAALELRSRAQGGYDVLLSCRINGLSSSVRQQYGADAQPVGTADVFNGWFGDLSSQGRYATLTGHIYDLESTGTKEIAVVEGYPGLDFTSLSFSPDGEYLASAQFDVMRSDIWNATSGKQLLKVPGSELDMNWLALFSPDGTRVAITVGNSVHILSTSNLTDAPVILNDFNDFWITMAWTRDNKRILVADKGRVRVLDLSQTASPEQTWEVVTGGGYVPPAEIAEFDEDEKRISWKWNHGWYMYDFGTNTEWLWHLGLTDHTWNPERFFYLKKRGYAVTVGGDAYVRFWKI